MPARLFSQVGGDLALRPQPHDSDDMLAAAAESLQVLAGSTTHGANDTARVSGAPKVGIPVTAISCHVRRFQVVWRGCSARRGSYRKRVIRGRIATLFHNVLGDV